jgi:hypothetical protein
MSNCNDDSVTEKNWSIKKLIEVYRHYFLKVNSDQKVSIIDSYNFECIRNEILNRGYEIKERFPIIRKTAKKQGVV